MMPLQKLLKATLIFLGTVYIKIVMTQQIMISFPNFWKTLMFLQFLKNERETETNYRPVSILPNKSKIYETLKCIIH